ncbi:MAG TPA: hypothetical protein PKH65_09405 [Bacteroidia bacterium]|nr:hypothetical protein [Bacteroidia bacterium]HNT80884.1 hypothetical protein [Bacteroidia bacterium]
MSTEPEILDGEEPNDFTSERHRVKVRKRIRVRKKKGSRRKFKKLFEYLIWAIVIVGFITTLVIMIKELDISDDKYKKAKKSKESSMLPMDTSKKYGKFPYQNKTTCLVPCYHIS